MDKYLRMFLLANRWIKIKQDGLKIGKFIDELGYKKVAIYGVGELGISLLKEFNGSRAKIIYGIDRNASSIHANIDLYKPDDDWKQVDLIIVTIISDFDEIETGIKEKMNCAVLSLEDIVYEM